MHRESPKAPASLASSYWLPWTSVALLSAASVHYIFRLWTANAALQQQLLQLRSQIDGQPEITGHKHWPNNGTMSAPSSGPSAAFDALSRTMALLWLICLLAAAYVVTKYVDALPEGLRQRLGSVLGHSHGRAASKVPLSKRIAYSADTWFSTNAWSKPLSLLYCTLAVVYIGGLGIYVVSGHSLYAAFWEAIEGVGINWSFAAGEADEQAVHTLPVRVCACLVSIGGMLVTALMLSIVSDTIENKIENMRQGHTDVLETGHTLILGWSDKVLPVVTELCKANSSEGGLPIVVLAQRDKVAMEEELLKHLPPAKRLGSRIVCRSGNPLLSIDLARVSTEAARSIIVLATADSPDRSDARTLRVALSLMGVHDRLLRAGGAGLPGHICAEVCDIDNEQLIKMVGPDIIQTVVSHDIIGRLMIQCARQPGLAAVWEQLLGFDGAEFYVQAWPELEGKRFDEVLLSFPDAVPIGVACAEEGCLPFLLLNPYDDYIMQPGDQIVVVAEDDDTYQPEPAPQDTQGGSCPRWRSRQQPEKVLFCGWRRDMDDMISVLDAFVVPGSELWLYNEVPVAMREKLLIKGGVNPASLRNLRLVYQDPQLEGELVSRAGLQALRPEQFSSILILADQSALFGGVHSAGGSEVMDADSRSLAALLLLRDLQARRMSRPSFTHADISARRQAALSPSPSPSPRPAARAESPRDQEGTMGKGSATPERAASGDRVLRKNDSQGRMWYDSMQNAVQRTVIISEILDSRTRHLISDLHVSEYVLSNELVSMALAMVAESRFVNGILAELFTVGGSELYIHPAARYLHKGEHISFNALMQRCREKSEIPLGYKEINCRQPVVNPPHKNKASLSLQTLEAVVVLSCTPEGGREPADSSRGSKAAADGPTMAPDTGSTAPGRDGPAVPILSPFT